MSKILVIEDESPILENVLELLQIEGYDVCGISDSSQALAAIAQWQPDLILCDIRMAAPNGLELLVEFKKTQFTHIPFIFLTAAADKKSINTAIGLNVTAFITKPFRVEELLSIIQVFLNDA